MSLKTILLVLLIAVALLAYIPLTVFTNDQLTNGSFEQWSGSVPTNWVNGGGADDYAVQNSTTVFDGQYSLEYVCGATSGSGNDGVYQANVQYDSSYIYLFDIIAYNPNTFTMYMRYQLYVPSVVSFYVTSDSMYPSTITYQSVVPGAIEHTKTYFLYKWTSSTGGYVFLRTNLVNGRFIVDNARLLNTGFYTIGNVAFMDGKYLRFKNSAFDSALVKDITITSPTFLRVRGNFWGHGALSVIIVNKATGSVVTGGSFQLASSKRLEDVELGYVDAGSYQVRFYSNAVSNTTYMDNVTIETFNKGFIKGWRTWK